VPLAATARQHSLAPLSRRTPASAHRESDRPRRAPTARGLAEPLGRPHGRAVSAILATADEPFRNRVLERLLAAGYDDLEVAELPTALAELLRETKQTLVIVGGTWPDPQAFLRVAVNAGALPLVLLECSALEAEGEALAMGARAALQSDLPAASLAAALAAVDAGLIVLEPSARALLLSANRDRFAPRDHMYSAESVAAGDQSLRHDPLSAGDRRSHRNPWSADEQLSAGYRSPGGAHPSHRDPSPAGEHPLQRDTFGTGPSNAANRPSNPATAPTPSVGAPPAGSRKGRPLTSREREILGLVASGTSNKGIARSLSVSANTVKFHLAAVFDKLNAATRAEAVAEAIRRGELSL
jgi:DNA-binding NarL/FixJ family response regulator